MAVRMENWEAGDFYREFHEAASGSPDDRFREKFESLAKAIEPLDREFCRETSRCGRDMSSMMEDLQSIAGRAGYCSRPRGYEDECAALFDGVDRVIERIGSLREVCFV